MNDTLDRDTLVTKTGAACLLEGILEMVMPGDSSVKQVREDILKMFEQRIGTTQHETPEQIETFKVLDLLNQERRSQRAGKYDNNHDDTHIDGELARFAACMMVDEPLYRLTDPKTMRFVSALPMEEVPEGDGDGGKEYRPWTLPKAKDKDRLDLYVKAGAVIVAEIERLRRVREVERCAKEAKRLATVGGLVVKGTRTGRVYHKKSNLKNRRKRRK